MDSQYTIEYEEVQCIGKGNFGKHHLFVKLVVSNWVLGAAFLVKNKAEQKEYIAKKIMLGSLNSSE